MDIGIVLFFVVSLNAKYTAEVHGINLAMEVVLENILSIYKMSDEQKIST